MRSINVITRDLDPTLGGIAGRCRELHRVGSLAELAALLRELPERPACSLDLIGHSTGGGQQLRLGDTVIDMLDPEVDASARAFAHELPRIGITAVRLLGCATAVEIAGQVTMRRLAVALGVRVFGTTRSLLKSHYDADGFHPAFTRILIEVRELPRSPRRLSIR